MTHLYRKIGTRYVPVDERWINPRPGVWIVSEDGRTRHWFMRLGDQPTVMLRAAMERRRECIQTVLLNTRGKSPHDTAQAILDAVAQEEEQP